MRFTVVGHFVLDTIVQPDGTKTESYGGIYFSVAVLANLASKDDTVCPVFGVGVNEYGPLVAHLRQYHTVDTSGIFPFEGATNSVRLMYNGSGHRIECSRHIAEPIPFNTIEKYLGADGILINMISGFDIELDTLDAIRMSVRNRGTPVHLDVHCLPLGIKGDFTRYYRPLPAWRRWCFMIDTVQMNEIESEYLSPDRQPEEMLAHEILAVGARRVLITRGERGATLYSVDRGRIARRDEPARGLNSAVDPTGSGDVFGAAFLIERLRSKDDPSALLFALDAAGTNAAYPGSTGVDAIARLLKRTEGNDGEVGRAST